MVQNFIRCHLCQSDECFDRSKWNFCFSKTGYCFTSVDLTNQLISHQRGCVEQEFYCRHSRGQYLTNDVDAYVKCCQKEYCNDDDFLTFNDNHYRHPHEHSDDNIDHYMPSYSSDFISYIPIIILSLMLLAIIVYYLSKFVIYLRRKSSINDARGGALDIAEKLIHNKDYKHELKVKTFNSMMTSNSTNDVSSGSGKGGTMLNKRTFSKEINLVECVGRGRYGEVWRGIFHFEDVAVKIFLSRDEASYQREIEIYSNNLQRHENILALIGCDVTSQNSCTQLWLVTAYHELGSLFDYLSQNSITMDDMISIMTSITHGLCYLHTEKFGTQRKPAIAHRDIKSKNILMKSKNVCCIADFGLAVTKEKAGSLNIACNYRVGTKRYMAPEVLDGTFNDKDFVSYTNSDIYSFALVLWEIIRRFESEQHKPFPYEVPYQHKVPSDPSFEDMRKVVCLEQYRPEIPTVLENPELKLNEICRIIRESWSSNPSSRLHALRIKKSLTKLYLPNKM